MSYSDKVAEGDHGWSCDEKLFSTKDISFDSVFDADSKYDMHFG